MATVTRVPYVSVDAEEGDVEIPNAFELKGLPTDKKKRNSALQGIGNAAKKRGAILIRRGNRAFVATTDAAADVIRSEHKVEGRGRKSASQYDSLFD